jgi:hypothetical protein
VSILCSLAGRYNYSAELAELSRVRLKLPLQVSRLFKKSSTDGNLTLFLPKRELQMQGETGTVEQLEGVVLIYKDIATRPTEAKVFIQVNKHFSSTFITYQNYPIRESSYL